jgi:hypothetical protein
VKKYVITKKYLTGLVWHPYTNETHDISSIKGRGWYAHWEKPRQVLHTSTSSDQKEVVLYASSRESAQRALNLIDNCVQLIFGDPQIFPMEMIAFNTREIRSLPEEERKRITQRTKGNTMIREACDFAARISQRKERVCALAKYCFSMNLHSTFSMDIQDDDPHYHVSNYPDDHVVFAHCIVSAYSAIEELGLEVRASKDKPSFIRNKWNSVVLNDLESRLKSAGIDLQEAFPWLLRNTRRAIEMKKSLPITRPAPWAYGRVRDHYVRITDAISYASWLISYVSSHTTKEVTRRLSTYDIANVQHLARRLLLESNDFWKLKTEKTL